MLLPFGGVLRGERRVADGQGVPRSAARRSGPLHRKVQQYKEIGVEQLLCLMQNYGIPHEKMMQSVRLWGEKVIPHFK